MGRKTGHEEDLDDAPSDARERERVLERFAASPYAAEAPDHGWIGLALEYAAEYLDTPVADLDADALDEIVFEILPRKVSCAPDAAPEVICSLRAFWSFARDVLDHPHAEECLEVLGADAVRRLERELADPSNFGLAKSLVMAGGVPDYRGRLDGSRRSSSGSSADKSQKKRLRKLRKKAQRRNRR